MALDRNFWTGVFVLGSGLVGVAAFSLSALHQFQPNVTRYSVAADELAGASAGTPVEMNGYELGIVEAVAVLPTPRLHFTLTIALEPDVTLPVGTVAVLASRTVAGGVVLRLVPPEGDAVGTLPPGSTLPATAAYTLPDLLAHAQGTLEDIDAVTAELRAVVVNGPDGKPGISATMSRANQSLDDLDHLIASLQATRDVAGPQIQKDLNHFDHSLAAADQAVDDVHGLVATDGSFPKLVTHLNDSLDQMALAAKAVQAYDPTGDTDIAKVVAQLDAASASMKAFMTSFEKRPIPTLTHGDDPANSPKKKKKAP